MSHPSFPSPVCPQARHCAFGHRHPSWGAAMLLPALRLCTMQGAQGWGVSPRGAEHWGVVLPETLKLEGAEAPTVGAAQGSPLWDMQEAALEKCLWSWPC